jgi:neutral ceramidase
MTVSYTAGALVITPTSPAPLAGYSGRSGVYDGVADDLEANVVVLREGDELTALISFDLLYVGGDLRRRLEEALIVWIKPDHLFLTASHTHFAPATDPTLPMLGEVFPDYVAMVVEKVGGLVRQLCEGELKPLEIRVGRAQAENAVNRRRVGWRLSRRFPFLRHGASMRPNPAGLKDETIRLIRLGNDAVIWNYACHPVFTPQMNHVSADFIGAVRRALRRRLGPTTAVLFWQGFSGDVYPSFASTMGGDVVDAGAYRRWTDSLASHVAEAYDAATPRNAGPIRSTRVSCSVNELLADGICDKTVWAQRIRIGPDVDILGLSAEVVTAYGERFRKFLQINDLFCVGCIDGVFGYLPTAEMLREGGYESANFMTAFGLAGKFRSDLEFVLETKLLTSLRA